MNVKQIQGATELWNDNIKWRLAHKFSNMDLSIFNFGHYYILFREAVIEQLLTE